MTLFRRLLPFALLLPLLLRGQTPFDAYFTQKTMRVDYYHTGGPGGEAVALDKIVSDGPWAGSHTRLVDDSNSGKYLFEVIDRESNRLLYSRGFATLYGEWETTPEVRETTRTFHESLRFPWPSKPVQIVLKKRDRENSFREFWSAVVDPNSRFVNRADPAPRGKVWTLIENGPSPEKVDLLLLGDGYSQDEMDKFHADARRMTETLFAVEPFKGRRGDFNVRAIDLPSARSGVNRPRTGDFRRSALGAEYNILDTDRYLLTYDNATLRDVAAAAPYEFIEILVNEKKYGGGGIFNFQATAAVDSAYADYVFVHEFGHHFAGLADEYYTSPVAYTTGGSAHVEPWEPNATAMQDPARLKWKELVEADTPLPTPWEKDEFEKSGRGYQERRRKMIEEKAPDSQVDQLMREQQALEFKLLSEGRYAGRVGAFEGANYEAKGLFRPEQDCIMFARNPVGFCRVCRRAIERIVDLYSK